MANIYQLSTVQKLDERDVFVLDHYDSTYNSYHDTYRTDLSSILDFVDYRSGMNCISVVIGGKVKYVPISVDTASGNGHIYISQENYNELCSTHQLCDDIIYCTPGDDGSGGGSYDTTAHVICSKARFAELSASSDFDEHKIYVISDDMTGGSSGSTDGCLPLTGGTMSGDLVLAGDPTTDMMAATKKYVDNVSKNITVRIKSTGRFNSATGLYDSEVLSNNNSWYRLYSDNWCEQGGRISIRAASLSTSCTMLKEYDDQYFDIYVTERNTNVDGIYYFKAAPLSTNMIYIGWNVSGTPGMSWETKGYAVGGAEYIEDDDEDYVVYNAGSELVYDISSVGSRTVTLPAGVYNVVVVGAGGNNAYYSGGTCGYGGSGACISGVMSVDNDIQAVVYVSDIETNNDPSLAGTSYIRSDSLDIDIESHNGQAQLATGFTPSNGSGGSMTYSKSIGLTKNLIEGQTFWTGPDGARTPEYANSMVPYGAGLGYGASWIQGSDDSGKTHTGYVYISKITTARSYESSPDSLVYLKGGIKYRIIAVGGGGKSKSSGYSSGGGGSGACIQTTFCIDSEIDDIPLSVSVAEQSNDTTIYIGTTLILTAAKGTDATGPSTYGWADNGVGGSASACLVNDSFFTNTIRTSGNIGTYDSSGYIYGGKPAVEEYPYGAGQMQSSTGDTIPYTGYVKICNEGIVKGKWVMTVNQGSSKITIPWDNTENTYRWYKQGTTCNYLVEKDYSTMEWLVQRTLGDLSDLSEEMRVSTYDFSETYIVGMIGDDTVELTHKNS